MHDHVETATASVDTEVGSRDPHPSRRSADPVAGELFAGPGEMRERCRALDWAATPLGAVDSWPVSLRTSAGLVLGNGFPSILLWGPERVQLYNDGYIPFLGAKHPAALGLPTHDCWPELRSVSEPIFERVQAGETVTQVEQIYPLERGVADRPAEDVPITISFGPVRDGTRVVGIYVTLFDVSAQVALRASAVERGRLLDELEAERDRLRSLILQMPAPVALHLGPEHRYALANDWYRQVSGAHRDLIGNAPRDLFPEVAATGVFEFFDRVYATGEPWDATEVLLPYDRTGEGRVMDAWFRVRLEPMRDAEERVVGILNFSLEITEQVRARHQVERLLAESERAASALADSEARFRAVQDSALHGCSVHRPVLDDSGVVIDFSTVYVNETALRMTGRTREEILGNPVLAVWPGIVDTGIYADMVSAFSSGEPTARELFYRQDEVDAGLAMTVVRVGEGAEAEVAATFADITARLQAEEERARLLAQVAAERERLRALILQMPAPVALLDGPDHRFSLVNDAFRRVSGGGRDVTGLTPQEGFPELAGSGIYELYDQVYRTGKAWDGPETPVRYDRDGTGIQDTWFNLRFEPVLDGAGRVTAILNFAVDVTEQVRARQEVERLLSRSERAHSEAAAANRAKSEFLAVMSHELRTPLNAIGGYTELLEMGIHGPVTEAQRTALGRIQVSQRHLLGLISGVLDYSRVEAGVVSYRLSDVPVGEAVAEAEALVAPQLRTKGLGYGWSGASPELRARADRDKLQQILLNLLGNAIKFTDARDGRPGRVEVVCGADGTGRVRIEVRDTGVGIPDEALERIFDPFVQADQRLTRSHGGIGLGLAISRDLARGMGGDLTAESTPGKGSTFTVVLPAAT
jgi:PAS domain S-box-containing protein